jgi:electron transfer flavoprotein beta subunit
MSYSIVVLIKQVPDMNAARINRSSGGIEFSGQMVINSFDDYAIEEALRIKEAHGGEVTAISAGGSATKDALTRALAMGADKAILVSSGDPDSIDTPALAKVLADAAGSLEPDIIFTGQMSDDFGSGEVGPHVAELLGLPQVSSATKVEVAGSTVAVQRDTEDGKQAVEVRTPVLIMAMTGLNEPRYPSLKGIMAAKKKLLKTVEATPVPSAQAAWSEPFVQERPAGGVIVQDVAADEAARQLVAWLRENKLA